MITTIEFAIAKLTVDKVREFNRDDTLYLVDFRATGETLNHEISSMFIYENLTQWLCSARSDVVRGKYVINSPLIQRFDVDAEHLVIASPASNPSVSVIDRLIEIPSDISCIWSGIPHPSIDKCADTLRIANNYRYTDFLHYNNKLKQKEVFQDLSPNFFEIHHQSDLDKALSIGSGYIKCALGAGGFTVFNISKQAEVICKKADKILADEAAWYYEEEVSGKPQSVQVYKKGTSYTLFGYAEQYIEGTNYVGAQLLDVNDMNMALVDFVKSTCKRINAFLGAYEGFFGIDIIVDGLEARALELNVRLTSTTIPTLLANNTAKHEKVEYLEETLSDQVLKDDVILAQSVGNKTASVLRFSDTQNE